MVQESEARSQPVVSQPRKAETSDGKPGRSAGFFSLRARLLALLAFVLIPWFGLLVYTQADERNTAVANVNRDAMRLIHIATSNQAVQIEAARQLLTALAELPQLRSANTAACNVFLAEMLRASPLYFNFGVVELDGNLRCSAVPMSSQVNVADRAYFQKALATRRFSIGDYIVGRVTRLPSITYAYPLSSTGGGVEGVVFAAQSLGWLTAALARLEFPRGAVLVVTDAKGTVLARVPEVEGTTGYTLPERRVLEALTAQPGGGVFELKDASGVSRLWAHAPLIDGHDLHATIGVPESVAFADIQRRLVRNLAGLGIVTVLALAAAWFGARSFILRQVDALVDVTGKLAAGDLRTRVPVLGHRSELGLLAHAFNSMAETLETRDRELRLAEERTRAAEIEVAVTRAEIDIAREIQRTLLPENPLAVAGLHLAGRCIPAVAVGGDYFGYFPRGRNRVDSFIGDVSGHGVGAAMLMAEARTIFMSERFVAPGAAPILARLNDLLFDDLDRANCFMSGCCATFDTASRALSYANAGHPPAILLRADETKCRLLEADGMLLGMAKSVRFTEAVVTLTPGDLVVFYTDGITERESETGEFFGVECLEEVLVAHRDEDPERLIASVLAALDDFAGARPYVDDVTIVVMKATG
jgi:serine phosphatase RsbU (regulator of sigma subunit)